MGYFCTLRNVGAHQIDVNFRMSKRTATAVASNNSIFGRFGWNLGDQVNGPIGIDFLSSIGESCKTPVIRIVCLYVKNNWMRSK